ncbi:MAG: hypothetical protein OXC67_04800 [Flavobacteriaceae bacterium]|nr:hypothetical protein [Flavobacteriaceae bacterium]MCY4298618.1 hypothetical protein [Flavobacteriaceae bacterium]
MRFAIDYKIFVNPLISSQNEPSIEQEYNVIPWSQMVGLRISLTHYYFNINMPSI